MALSPGSGPVPMTGPPKRKCPEGHTYYYSNYGDKTKCPICKDQKMTSTPPRRFGEKDMLKDNMFVGSGLSVGPDGKYWYTGKDKPEPPTNPYDYHKKYYDSNVAPSVFLWKGLIRFGIYSLCSKSLYP